MSLFTVTSAFADKTKKKKRKRVRIKGTIIPCIKKLDNDSVLTRLQRKRLYNRKADKTKWLVSDDKSCLQYNDKNIVKLGELKVEFKALLFTTENQSKQITKLQKAGIKWAGRKEIWAGKERLQKRSDEISATQIKNLRGIIKHLKDNQPKKKWYKSPLFVAACSVALTLGTLAVAVTIINSGKSTSSKALLIRYP